MQSREGWMEGTVRSCKQKAMDMEEEEEEEVLKIKRLKKHDDDSSGEKEEASCRVVDRISELPEFIIHHILSFLESSREVTKTSVLSKRWYHHIWASYPVLNFVENHFFQGSPTYPKDLEALLLKLRSSTYSQELKALRLKFVNFVDKSLLRYQINRFRINQFCLHIRLYNSHVASLVEKWIRFVVAENQLEGLDLRLGTLNMDAAVSFSLPQSFFSKSKSLKVLKLYGCSIGPSCCRDQIAFGSLKGLCLQQVCFYDEQVLDNIISSCPLLEEIILRYCDGFKKFQLHGLKKLRSVIVATKSIEPGLIDIEARSLQSFSFNNNSRHYVPRIDMAACKNLKALYLADIATNNWQFHDFIAQFPLLETLVLDSCMMIERLMISSSCLKSFRLIRCENLLEAEIEAPNLLSFEYNGDNELPHISSTNTCGEWEATFGFTRFINFDSNWFIILRQFLSIAKHFKVFTLLLRFDRFGVDDFLGLSNISTLSSFELEHLKLEISCLSSNYPPVLDGLLWSCRPRMVTLSVSDELANCPYQTDFIKYLYEKLSHTAHTCCDDSYMMYSSKHNANKVEIEISEQALSRGRATDLSVLLDILPTIVGQVIQFRISRLETSG